jgi:prepilin-type processing-associated H-X9-DG protein
MSEVSQPRLSTTALLTFVLGVSSLLLLVATALPALFFGVQALREINRSDGQVRGQRLAITGLVLGGIMTVLTVVGTVGMIVLLLQEKSQRAGCMNNLRLLGQAAERYRVHREDYFPPGTVVNNALTPEQRLSWQSALVPYLSEGGPAGRKWEQLAGNIAFEQAWNSPANAGLRQNVAPFLCPTFLYNLPSDQVGLTSYIGMAGLGLDAPRLPLGDPRVGFFGYDRRIKQNDITSAQSATMMVAESEQSNGPWAEGGPSTVRGLDADCQRFIGRGGPFGGLHRDAAYVLFVDGSVQAIPENVDPIVFRNNSRITRPEAE